MKYKIITPNINLQAKNPRLAYIARGTVLIGTFILYVLQVTALMNGEFDLIPILLGMVPLIVEFDYFTLFVKEPQFRGVLYLIVGALLYGVTEVYISGIVFLGGILFIIYNYQ